MKTLLSLALYFLIGIILGANGISCIANPVLFLVWAIPLNIVAFCIAAVMFPDKK